MIDLTAIHNRQDRPRRIVLYGTGGIGKSTWGSCAPAPIFLPTEDGLGDIDAPRFPTLTSYAECIEALTSLVEGKHDYKTAVLDSLDRLEWLIWEKVCASENKKNIEEIGYAKGYTFALDYWQEILGGFSALRERGMTVILIGHAGIEKMQNPLGDDYDRHAPRLHKKAAAFVVEWADEVLFASYKLYTHKKTEDKKSKSTGIGTGERLIYTTERPAYVAKNRLNLPDELPLVWAEYQKFVPGAVKQDADKIPAKEKVSA